MRARAARREENPDNGSVSDLIDGALHQPVNPRTRIQDLYLIAAGSGSRPPLDFPNHINLTAIAAPLNSMRHYSNPHLKRNRHDGVDEDDAHIYAEGVRRGGTLVTVRVQDDLAATARAILLCSSAPVE